MQIINIDNTHTPHGVDVYPQSAADVPFTTAYIACKGDPIANLQEDLAAEQKARATYEKLIDLCRDNPDVLDPLHYLREREVVHFQRFGEALRGIQDKLATKRMYMKYDMQYPNIEPTINTNNLQINTTMNNNCN
jgi:spore coat protein JC